MEKTDATSRAILRQIANALGVPFEQFFTGGLPFNADECLCLWSRIRTEEGRQRALDALRAIADEETL